MKFLKKFVNNLKALIIGLLVAFIILEVILRAFPNKYTDYGSTVTWELKPSVGLTLAPGQTASFNAGCYRISPIKANSKGFRDKEWDRDSYKIAILGDSSMEALQVPEGIYTARLLERILDIDVMNTGISSHGTLHEYLIYEKYLSKYSPSTVLLFFNVGNDLADNSYKISRLVDPYYADLKPGAYIKDDNIIVKFSNPPLAYELNAKVRLFIKKICTSFLYLQRLRQDLIKRITKVKAAKNIDMQWQVYIPSSNNDEWNEAWRITEYYLLRLKKRVEEDGGKLILVFVPNHWRVLNTWKQDFLKEIGLEEIPENFDFLYPVRRLRDITERNGIESVDLEPYFLEYRDKFTLGYPYFSYRCDGHWNPIGHFITANIIAKYLLQKGLVSVSDREKMLERIENNLDLNPKEILGIKAYKQIYNGGVYYGESNIDEILYYN